MIHVVNVAQKTYGYQNTTGFPFSAPILEVIDFVDASLGAIINKLKSKDLYNITLVVVASKHGNAPINPALFGEVNPAQITNATGVPVQWQTVFISTTTSLKPRLFPKMMWMPIKTKARSPKIC